MSLLPTPPSDRIVTAAIQGDQRSLNQLLLWFKDVFRILGALNGIGWEMVDKTGSSLDEIETRTHAMLQAILDWEGGTNNRHISVENGVDWQAHVDVIDGNPHGTDHAHLDAIGELDPTSANSTKDKHLSNAQGKVWQDHVNNDAQDDHSQYLLLAGRTGQTVTTPLILGDATDNTTVEEDGTVKFNGAGRVWKDVFFPMAPPKATGAGNPTLTTWLGNLRGYVYAVNDTHDFDPQEFTHDGKEGSTGQFHIHFVSRTNVAATRAVKFRLEYSQADRNGVFPAPTTVETEIVIPANTTANTHFAEDLASFTTGLIASQMFVKLTRIAAAGTAPADDPIIIGVHYHYELDTVGSRQIFTKENP
jgi:hypothetical protein